MGKSYYEAHTYRPRKKRRKKRRRFFNPKSLLIIFIFIIIIVGALFVTSSDIFNIENVEVENNQISNKQEIIV